MTEEGPSEEGREREEGEEKELTYGQSEPGFH